MVSPTRTEASTALYRKYRPQDFDEVVGQEAIVRTLRNAIEREQVRQAYLFAGPRGTGKTSLARILAKALNCERGPTVTPCGQCVSCVTIARGTSLDVIEMDAASQRGIDDIREIRDHVVLQPVQGQHKVYILDEAHQLTDAAFNALLKLIEEPPPHLVFVFCTTDLAKMLPTVRSRCQTFRFERPRLGELTRLLRRVADGEQISVPDAALAMIARSSRGSFRDAVSTLDQLSAATGGDITVNGVLELLGTVDEEALFRLCDLVVDGDTPGVLTFVEELAEQGQDMGRLVTDLLEHLRHLMLVQHTSEVPESLPLTEDTRERLRAQANHLGPAAVLRLIDLLAVAVEDMRQGGDPRLPLELALVKVTQPEHDGSKEAILQRLERLEAQAGRTLSHPARRVASEAGPAAERTQAPPSAPPEIDLPHLQQQWGAAILPQLNARSIPAGSMFAESRPVALDGSRLVVEFPAHAAFHRSQAEEPRFREALADALLEVTGVRFSLEFTLREAEHREEEGHGAQIEEDFVSLLKNTLDAREVTDS